MGEGWGDECAVRRMARVLTPLPCAQRLKSPSRLFADAPSPQPLTFSLTNLGKIQALDWLLQYQEAWRAQMALRPLLQRLGCSSSPHRSTAGGGYPTADAGGERDDDVLWSQPPDSPASQPPPPAEAKTGSAAGPGAAGLRVAPASSSSRLRVACSPLTLTGFLEEPGVVSGLLASLLQPVARWVDSHPLQQRLDGWMQRLQGGGLGEPRHLLVEAAAGLAGARVAVAAPRGSQGTFASCNCDHWVMK